MLRLAPAVALLLPTLLGGCGKPLSSTECENLLDRYVDLLARSDHPHVSAGELLHLQVEARAKAARDPAFSKCSRNVSRSQYNCAMKANDADELERCLM